MVSSLREAVRSQRPADFNSLLTVSGAKGIARGIALHEAEMIVLFEDKKPEKNEESAAREPAQRPLFGRASRRKAQAIADVADGRLTADEACLRYGVTPDALATWQRALQSFGFRSRRDKPGGPRSEA